MRCEVTEWRKESVEWGHRFSSTWLAGALAWLLFQVPGKENLSSVRVPFFLVGGGGVLSGGAMPTIAAKASEWLLCRTWPKWSSFLWKCAEWKIFFPRENSGRKKSCLSIIEWGGIVSTNSSFWRVFLLKVAVGCELCMICWWGEMEEGKKTVNQLLLLFSFLARLFMVGVEKVWGSVKIRAGNEGFSTGSCSRLRLRQFVDCWCNICVKKRSEKKQHSGVSLALFVMNPKQK